MFLLTLTPLKDGGDGVNVMLPVIQLHSHPSSKMYSIDNKVRLGRNRYTMITDANLPRKLLTVEIDQRGKITLTLHMDFDEHSALLNGEKIGNPEAKNSLSLKDGAILSLLGDNRYQYRLSLREDTVIETRTLEMRNKRTAATTTVAVAEQQSKIQACEELMCPICWEILCDTVALDPCGHLFCMTCIKTTQKCSYCKTNTRGAMRIKTIDSHILKMVKIGKLRFDSAWSYLFVSIVL